MREQVDRGRGRLTSIPTDQTHSTEGFYPDLSISRYSFERRGRGVGFSPSGHPEACLTWRKGADAVLQVCLLGASVQNRVQLILWGEAWRFQEANRRQKPAWMDLVLSQGCVRTAASGGGQAVGGQWAGGRRRAGGGAGSQGTALLCPPKLVTDCVRSSC